MVKGSQTTEFVYDGDGQRVKRIGPDGQETIYIGDYLEVKPNNEIISIASGPENSETPSLALDTTGAAQIVWKGVDGIYLSQPAGTPVKIPGTNASSKLPTIAVDANNTIHVAWSEGSLYYNHAIYYTYRPAGMEWVARERVSQPTYGTVEVEDSHPPTIVVATDGKVHIVWTQYSSSSTFGVYHRVYQNGAPISTPFKISPDDLKPQSNSPDLAAGPHGEVNVVWWGSDRLIGQFTPIGEIYYRRWNGSSWDSFSRVPLSDGSNKSMNPTIAVDSQGTVHVAWHYADEDSEEGNYIGRIFYRFKKGTAWSPTESISDEQSPAWVDPAIAAGGDGDVYLTWTRTHYSLVYAHRSSGKWTLPSIITYQYYTQFPASKRIAYGPGFGAHLVFMRRKSSSDYDVFYTQLDRGSVTKHYYANGQRIASRIGSDLYYLLADPTGQAVVVTDETGQEAGHILYDPLGEVIDSTLSEAMIEKLTGQFEATTDLWYNSHRWYDPGFGVHLQPGGIGSPLIFQYVNASASVSPGTPRAVSNSNKALLPYVVSAMSTLAVEQYGTDVVKSLAPYTSIRLGYVGRAKIQFTASDDLLLDPNFATLLKEYNLELYQSRMGSGRYSYKIWKRLVAANLEDEVESIAKRFGPFAAGGLYFQAPHSGYGEYGLAPIDLEAATGWSKVLGIALDVGVNAGFQYLEDVNNPYLTGPQVVGRAGISGLGGAMSAVAVLRILGFVGCRSSLVCGITAGVIGSIGWSKIQPEVFKRIPGLQPAVLDPEPLSRKGM